MKHLKKFDESESKSYQEMEEELFYQERDSAEMKHMSDRTGSMIMKHLLLESHYHLLEYGEKKRFISIVKNQSLGIGPGSIVETDDEWFWFWIKVGDQVKSFKCDQLSGLFECFRKLKIYIRSESKNLLTEELTGKYKEETEIIYKDRNLVCMVPKSQMTSHIYGKKTAWCQVTKSGFGMWTKPRKDILGLLVRFLFKSGRKIRFSYFTDGTFHWANEQGWHVLMGKEGDDVFSPECPKKNIRDLEKDILEQIRLIPEECKEKVREFLERNRKEYQYVYREEGYMSPDLKRASEVYDRLRKEYRSDMEEIRYDGTGRYLGIEIDDRQKNRLIILWRGLGHKDTTEEEFKFAEAEKFEKRFLSILQSMLYQDH